MSPNPRLGRWQSDHGGSVTFLTPWGGLPKTNRFCAGIKGGLSQRRGPAPRFKATRAGWEGLSGAAGSPVAPCPAGAAEGPGTGSAAGARPGSSQNKEALTA